MAAKPISVDAYMAGLPDAARPTAQRLRALIHAAAPETAEAIRYGMPAFQAEGATFIYLGAWTRHVAVYPIYRGEADFEAKVAPFRSGKDSVRFDLDRDLPEDLIALIVRAQRGRVARAT
ncbi:iron chaperone [uncultured Phenylobacterium sp.]|uniref:iron chaperone n=1 Tax=uncultured Phenylobacterium sp. TaxID=349273 RepID=UPI0025E94B5B|nr:DUF1801 domain-containing protein [uncultured Phenylobacterium sp.]